MADLIRRGEWNQRLRGSGDDGGGYDHDEISTHDLVELGLAALLGEVGDTRAEGIEGASGADGGSRNESSVATQPTGMVGSSGELLAPVELEHLGSPTLRMDSEIGLEAGSVDDACWSNAGYPDEQGSVPEDALDTLWLQPVPEPDEEPGLLRAPEDKVSSSERAVQLALEFLRSEGISLKRNLDLLADIIQERGWTSVQFQVRGLVRAGYDVAQVHRMFELTDAWQHFLDSDTLAPERWHGGKRLTWAEAAQLLDFMGYEASLEEVADLLAVEKEVWQQLRRSSGQLATFTNYLFGYRLSSRTQVDDGIWQVNLDAGDPRSFDGTRNSLCRLEWWDEPVEGNPWTLQQILGSCHDLGGLAEWLAPESRNLFG